MPPMRWLLRYRRDDGGWDVRSFRGPLEEARAEASRTLQRSNRYESVWIVEYEERKL